MGLSQQLTYLYPVIKSLIFKGRMMFQRLCVVLVILTSLLSLNLEATGCSGSLSSSAKTEWVDPSNRVIHVKNGANSRVCLPNSHSLLALLLNENLRQHRHFLFQQKKFRSVKANLLPSVLFIPFQENENYLPKL